MSNYLKFAIIASFFGLWIDSFLKKEHQIIIGFILIFSFGILHGANDLLLIEKIKTKKSSNSFLQVLLVYVIIVILGAMLFYFLSWLALLLFIIVSGYHFGEQNWQGISKTYNNTLVRVFQWIYGCFILLLLFYFHTNEVVQIILDITNVSISENYLTYLLLFFGSALAICILYFYVMNKKIAERLVMELFFLLVFAIIFKSASLIFGFALYFVLWHSIPSIIDQVNFIYGKFSVEYCWRYFRSAFVYWIVSLIGIAGAYYILKEQKLFDAVFFSFLAAITFPHVLVIIKMLGSQQKTEQ